MKIQNVKTEFLKIPLLEPIADSINKVSYIGLAVVRITTEDGLEGWGYSWYTAGGAEFSKELIDRYMIQHLIGKDIDNRKKITSELFYVENFAWDPRLGRTGLSVMAVSAIDIALWDLVCKKVNLPLWKLLGGYQKRVEAYDTNGGWLSWDIEKLVQNSKNLVRAGYQAIKIKVGSENPADDYERIKAVRGAIGNSVKMMIDANTKWDLDTALFWGRRFDDFGPFWFEEPISALDIRGHAELRKKIQTPIAIGESITNKYTFRDYVLQGAADILQPDVTKLAGITEWLEVASLAEAFGLSVHPHTNIQQPIHVQLVASSRNGGFVEHVPWLLDVWKYPLVPKNGYFELPQFIGVGSEIREEALHKYSIKSSY
jgi:L-alanine-DL-glutamate epimerase-like enolase superfamily enzyme